MKFITQKRKTLQFFMIGSTILNCIAKLGHRIPVVVHYSEIKVLFPVLRKLITSTDNQIKNVKLTIAESNNKLKIKIII